MPRMGFPIVGLIVGVLAPLAVGCDGAPSRVPSPYFEAAGATSRLFAQADADKDGNLDRTELLKAPSVLSALKTWDSNGDGKVSQAEATARFKLHAASGLPLVNTATYVTRNGQPVAGAEIRFIPEPFMGAGFHKAAGKTDSQGFVTLISEGEPLPGVRCGMYRVEASLKDASGKEQLPAKFNAESTLGYDLRQESSQKIDVDLK